MEPDTNDIDLNKQLAERFAELPKVVQDAITSADVQQHLRGLAETRKLHLDQWQSLENNVMLALLGFQPVENLPQNLENDLSISKELAAELATDISDNVFAPIRHEMERNIESTAPAATPQTEAPAQAAASAVIAATPPPAPPTEKAIRGSIAPAYVASASHERKSIEGDPYREQLL